MRASLQLAAVVCAAGLILGSRATGQDPGQTGEQAIPTIQPRNAGDQSAPRPDRLVRVGGENLPEGLFKADDLEEVEVFNAQHEEVGEIEEIVIDAKTGKIRYVAVEVDEGFLGLADKLVAVPWNDLQFTHREGDPEDVVVVLRGDRQRLEHAPALADDGIWPATAKVIEGRAAEQQSQPNEQARSRRNLPQGLFKADELEGLDLFNAQNKELGEIEDIVIDVETGTLRYVAVEVGGGFLGIGESLVAVPWDALQLTHKEADPGDVVALLNVDRQAIENAPKIDEGVWPAWAQTGWLQKAVETEQRQARQPAAGEEPARR